MPKKKKRKKKSNPMREVKGKVVRVNWVLVLVMSIVFGMLGVDRFIMGKVGTGVAKLLITVFTFGIFGWVWWLVDLILIATKHEFEDVEWLD